MTTTRSIAKGIAGLVLILLPETALAQERAATLPPIRALRLAPIAAEPVAVRVAPMLTVAQREITPPPEVSTRAISNSVTLQSGAYSTMVKSLDVIRQLPLAQLRSNNPVLMLGNTRINMEPVLSNPRALFNVAQRIRLQPQLAEVIADDTQGDVVRQGLILRSFMTYRIKPGVCNDPQRRSELGQSGVSCATYLSGQARAAAFANPQDTYYVADPAARAQAVADAESKSALLDAELNANVAHLRASLSDPATRAQLDTERGAGESVRLAALSDEQLKEELVNTGSTSVEQTAFVPNSDRIDTMSPTATAAKPPAAEQAKPDVDVTTPLNPHIFLTGFTLGRNYEWKERVEKEIGWCKVYCKTYYAEAYVSFSYALGLRFPIRLEGTYQYHKSGTVETATVTPIFTPINGNAADYASTGLPDGLVYEGKEIVAQMKASAGAGYDLPGAPANSVDFAVAKDFTEYLSDDFTNGQFAPPAPGAANLPKMNKVFDNIDLLGERANFGILAVRAFPAIKLELTSDSLTFNFRDTRNPPGKRISSGEELNLLVQASNHSSQFTIGDPVYNASFLITPGIDARLSLNIAVWRNNWDWILWFPELEIKLPPNGADFGCHAETVCSRTYTFTPTSQSDTAGPEKQYPEGIEKWGYGFDGKWMSECPDETCRFGLRFVRQGTIYTAGHKYDANNNITLNDLGALFAQADKDAQGIVNEGQARQTVTASKSYSTLLLAVWSNRCSDTLCFENIKGIIFFAQWEMNAMQNQHPDMSTNEVLGTAGKKFVPNLQAEVDASKARVAAEEALQKTRLAAPILIYQRPIISGALPTPEGTSPTEGRAPAPPTMTPSRPEMPMLMRPPIIQNGAPSVAPPPAVQSSTLCRFTSGPRAGQIQDYAPMDPIAVGSNCQDARGSYGTVVAQ